MHVEPEAFPLPKVASQIASCKCGCNPGLCRLGVRGSSGLNEKEVVEWEDRGLESRGLCSFSSFSRVQNSFPACPEAFPKRVLPSRSVPLPTRFPPWRLRGALFHAYLFLLSPALSASLPQAWCGPTEGSLSHLFLHAVPTC